MLSWSEPSPFSQGDKPGSGRPPRPGGYWGDHEGLLQPNLSVFLQLQEDHGHQNIHRASGVTVTMQHLQQILHRKRRGNYKLQEWSRKERIIQVFMNLIELYESVVTLNVFRWFSGRANMRSSIGASSTNSAAIPVVSASATWTACLSARTVAPTATRLSSSRWTRAAESCAAQSVWTSSSR